VLSRFGVPVHVGHFAGKAAVEPVAQAIEAVGFRCRRNPCQIEA
jgi:hypothetical protein